MQSRGQPGVTVKCSSFAALLSPAALSLSLCCSLSYLLLCSLLCPLLFTVRLHSFLQLLSLRSSCEDRDPSCS